MVFTRGFGQRIFSIRERRWIVSELTVEELGTELLRRVHELPDGKKIDQCIQCGTCSASCPTSEVMEYSPREIIAAIRAGMIDRVLKSNTVWMCASYYSCAVRCPAKIPFTDVMYELKRLGVKHDIHPKKSTRAAMAGAFCQVIDRHGRNSDTKLILMYYLRTNPLKILGQMGFASKLFFKRRLEMFPKTIKGIKGLQKMMAAAEENGKE
jgi:heterodisulfide reductase subunit C